MNAPSGERNLFASIDRLLRGGFSSPEDLVRGRVGIPTPTLLLACLLLGAFYGAMMGLYGTRTDHAQMMLSGALKVPLLFLLTLCVTFPSLYVFSALARSRLGGIETLRLLLIAIAVTMTVLASFGPVTAFFTFSTSSYPFLKLLNVLFFGVAGLTGLSFLRRALKPMLGYEPSVPASPSAEPVEVEQGDLEERLAPASKARLSSSAQKADPARSVFRAWIVIYGIVGAQMGWILRPFIGDPEQPFQWFRAQQSNFLHDLLRTISDLLG